MPLHRNKSRNIDIAPDEIFLDSHNIQDLNRAQFEGRIEKPISLFTIGMVGGVIALCGLFFLYRAFTLEVQNGQTYFEKSEQNYLRYKTLFAKRGVIMDRNETPLAWNVPNESNPEFPLRSYVRTLGLAHVVGYVKYPAQDNAGVYYQSEYVGHDGAEKAFQDELQGENGTQIIEINALGKAGAGGQVLKLPTDGKNVLLSIDSRVQSAMYTIMESIAKESDFQGGAAVLMDVKTGEIIGALSYPEYDPQVMTDGTDTAKISEYLQSKKKLFLDRPFSGLYTPGSIVKPIMAMGALAENLISPTKQILSTGELRVPNPYNPEKDSIFKDWKAHGLVDLRHAIAVSSNVYFYTIGGGFGTQKGLGIERIEKYARLFGLGEKVDAGLGLASSGVIPNPAWKAKAFPEDPDWRLGDTYHTVIGQYGFQVTPLQMTRAVAAIANGGTLVQPTILRQATSSAPLVKNINIPDVDFQIVREGMRLTVTEGTSPGLRLPFVTVAGKTGTAQTGLANEHINSWVEGFFPYDNPRYAFAVLMERGLDNGSRGAVSFMHVLLTWMYENTPEYLK